MMVLIVSVGTFLGCTTAPHTPIIPGLSSDHIKAFKSVKVYANNPLDVKTGVHVDKGEFYTLFVTGRVGFGIFGRGSIQTFGSQIIKPEEKLGVIIGKQHQIAPPINATLRAPNKGEINLIVIDYGFWPELGNAKHWPRAYGDNSGSFDTTVIVWDTKEIDKIIEVLSKFRDLNYEDETVERLIAQANSLKDSLAETAIVTSAVKDSSTKNLEQKTISSDRPEFSDKKSAELAISEYENQSESPRKDFNEKPAVPELPKDQHSPLMLLLYPRGGEIVSTPTIQLVGVVEDDQGLKDVEITVNEAPIDPSVNRGIVFNSVKPSSRYEFNEKVPVAVGLNQIKVRAEDINGHVSEKIVSIRREESRDSIWAVIVGIDNYSDLPHLKYAVNDAQAFNDFLLETGFVRPDNTFLITNNQARLSALRTVLGTTLKQKAGKEDMVIIYFAGHGATERDSNSPDGDGLEKYLLPFDADPENLYASALPMREISYILNRIKSDRLIFIADSCYSGASGGRTVGVGGIRSNLSESYIDRIAGGKGRVIITASAANEVSVEDDNLEHGIFTYYLLEGLKGSADYDTDGLVTVDEAYRYVSEKVPDATGQEQHPIKKGSVEGQLVLGVVN